MKTICSTVSVGESTTFSLSCFVCDAVSAQSKKLFALWVAYRSYKICHLGYILKEYLVQSKMFCCKYIMMS